MALHIRSTRRYLRPRPPISSSVCQLSAPRYGRRSDGQRLQTSTPRPCSVEQIAPVYEGRAGPAEHGMPLTCGIPLVPPHSGGQPSLRHLSCFPGAPACLTRFYPLDGPVCMTDDERTLRSRHPSPFRPCWRAFQGSRCGAPRLDHFAAATFARPSLIELQRFGRPARPVVSALATAQLRLDAFTSTGSSNPIPHGGGVPVQSHHVTIEAVRLDVRKGAATVDLRDRGDRSATRPVERRSQAH